MRPLPFFAGLLSGLIALSVLGATVHNDSLAKGFVRFHAYTGLASGYMPTARELRTIVNYGARRPRVYVVVGGSSVLNGVGQARDRIWTSLLQERLGAEFRVINFAQRGGGPSDFGSVAAEMLLRLGNPVIFIGDGNQSIYSDPLSRTPYRYILLDAWHRGFLLPWAPRDAALQDAVFDANQDVRNSALGEWLNAFLNFNDLWNYVTYNFAGSQWNSLLTTRSFDARRTSVDPDVAQKSVYLHHDLSAELKIVNDAMSRPTEQMIDALSITEQMTPPELRAVSLVILQLMSPYYLDRLGPSARQELINKDLEHAAALRAAGFYNVVVPAVDFTEDDYHDRLHLSSEGGEKLANYIAPVVRQMADDLGYLK
jgi:hypothetical protein